MPVQLPPGPIAIAVTVEQLVTALQAVRQANVDRDMGSKTCIEDVIMRSNAKLCAELIAALEGPCFALGGNEPRRLQSPIAEVNKGRMTP